MKPFPKTLVPLDSKDVANINLDELKTLAEKLSSKLLLLHVSTEENAATDASKKSLEDIKESLKQSQLEVQVLEESGSLSDRSLRVASGEDTDLILEMSGTAKEPSEKDEEDWEKLIRKSKKSVWIMKKGGKALPSKILCPVDFSKPSKLALNHASQLCRLLKAELVILMVFEPLSLSFPSRLEIDYELENQKIKNEKRKQLDSFLKDVNLEGIRYDRRLLQGEPNQKIVEQVQKGNMDLLVMGATGKSMLQRMFLGSVTESVMRELPCSMLISKG